METNRCPKGPARLRLFDATAAIASALVQRENAHILRCRVRDWLDRFDETSSLPFDDMDAGVAFAEFLTDLARVGAGLRPS